MGAEKGTQRMIGEGEKKKILLFLIYLLWCTKLEVFVLSVGMMLNSVTMFFLDMHAFLRCSGYTILFLFL